MIDFGKRIVIEYEIETIGHSYKKGLLQLPLPAAVPVLP